MSAIARIPLADIPHACGSGLPLIAVDPGDEPIILGFKPLHDVRGRPAIGWCRACWPVLARTEGVR